MLVISWVDEQLQFLKKDPAPRSCYLLWLNTFWMFCLHQQNMTAMWTKYEKSGRTHLEKKICTISSKLEYNFQPLLITSYVNSPSEKPKVLTRQFLPETEKKKINLVHTARFWSGLKAGNFRTREKCLSAQSASNWTLIQDMYRFQTCSR
jgi:hypothetical protein